MSTVYYTINFYDDGIEGIYVGCWILEVRSSMAREKKSGCWDCIPLNTSIVFVSLGG